MFRAFINRFLTRPAAPAGIEHVVDPDGGLRLVRVSGTATRATVVALDELAAGLGWRECLHLDLRDADIDDAGVMRGLERFADRLETAGVRVRVVGVDPQHPLLDTAA